MQDVDMPPVRKHPLHGYDHPEKQVQLRSCLRGFVKHLARGDSEGAGLLILPRNNVSEHVEPYLDFIYDKYWSFTTYAKGVDTAWRTGGPLIFFF
jgi:hypothetical protein